MPEKKRQHYVPKFYMQLFTNQDNLFSVYNISNRRIVPNVPYDSQCYKDYFYGKDGIWENRLSDMETVWATIIRLALSKAPLTDEDKSHLKRFALYQRQRTMAERNHSKQIRKELMKEYAKSICTDKGWLLEDEDIDKLCEQRANESIAPAETLQLAEQYMNAIEDLDIVIIEYETEQKLISSDVPVISINPFHQQTIGYGCMGLIVLFPISPHHLVVLYDHKMYPKFKGQTYVTVSNETEVFNLNTLQLISAEKILFAKDSTDFSVANAKNWNIRERNRSSTDVYSLGPNSHKMIGVSLRRTILECVFSFGKVRSNFARIPYPCREAVPRTRDKEWEEKLDMQAVIMSQLTGYQLGILRSLSLTRKELRKGYNQMSQAAKRYWRDV